MLMIWTLICCAKPGDSTESQSAELPPQDTDPALLETGEPWEWVDTGTADQNREPTNVLYVYQDGMLELSPSNGPYTSAVGTLDVLERLDSPRVEDTGVPPQDTGQNGGQDSATDPAELCALSYALTGVGIEDVCATCEFGVELTFYLNEGDITACHDTSLPEHNAVWRLAFDEAAERLMLDFGNSGAWVPWYQATLVRNTLTFSFTTTLGITVEEEEE